MLFTCVISVKYVTSFSLQGLSLTSVHAALFANNTKLRYLSLGHNSFTTLDDNLLDGLDSLSELHLYNTLLDCSCTDLWFYPHADTTRMKIYGDVICNSPASWESTYNEFVYTFEIV